MIWAWVVVLAPVVIAVGGCVIGLITHRDRLFRISLISLWSVSLAYIVLGLILREVM